MSIALLFPGQGSQAPGMLHRLPDHPAVLRTIEEMSAALGHDASTLDSPEALRSTVSVQLALLAAGVAAARALEEEGVIPEAVAGLSVGAFAAAVHARVLAFSDCVRLVKQRAELMERNSPDGYGLMAIVGLEEEQVVTLIQEANTAEDPVYLGNVNAPEQIVLSGSRKGLQAVARAALRAGARKAERLNVPVLSHSPLLKPIADTLTQSLHQIPLHSPRMVYLGNVNARELRNAGEIARDLSDNIAHGVRWYEATAVLQELGCSLFIEMPPGRVLTGLAQDSFPEVRSIALAESSLSYVVQQASRHPE
ncbi:MAG: malonate decarboxylase subunit epsilon [Verrucomicrobia bacterium]|nr:malonate decarboxylase subunit epsilon [Verrucomicrobiota bacterium]